ncbi:MAG: hypothetical protein ABIQ87_08290 [Rubrivivax sp.]
MAAASKSDGAGGTDATEDAADAVPAFADADADAPRSAAPAPEPAVTAVTAEAAETAAAEAAVDAARAGPAVEPGAAVPSTPIGLQAAKASARTDTRDGGKIRGSLSGSARALGPGFIGSVGGI